MQDTTRDNYGITIAKKAERLVTALYLVTDLIEGSEPIKNGLRKNSIVLLSSMNALAQHEVKDKMTEFSTSLKSVTEIISLLHVAGTIGLISGMNSELLIEGFRVLQLVLEKKQPTITKEMLAVDSEDSLYDNKSSYAGIQSTSYDALTPLGLVRMQEDEHNKKTSLQSPAQVARDDSHKRQITTPGRDSATPDKGRISLPNPSSLHASLLQHVHEKSSTFFSSSFQNKKQGRREQIKALFVKGVDVSIKDIAMRIKGCSEKTIQRELNALVYDNVIERIGEKRWSRYVLR